MLDKIVTIDWIDVSKTMNDDAFNENSNIDELLANMKSIGWLYKETDKTIMLVQEFDNGKPRDWIVIPKVLINNL